MRAQSARSFVSVVFGHADPYRKGDTATEPAITAANAVFRPASLRVELSRTTYVARPQQLGREVGATVAVLQQRS
jgi:hypothetical protein